MGDRWQFKKVVLTTQAMVADTFFFSLSEIGKIIEKNEGRSLRVVKDGLPIPMGNLKNQKGPALQPQLGLFPATLLKEWR